MTTERYCPICGNTVEFTLDDDYTWRDAANHPLPVTDQDDRLKIFELFFNGWFDDNEELEG